MEIKQAVVLDGSEPLSKALGSILDSNTAVIISKNGKYYGLIDDRNLRVAGADPAKVKCETVVVKPPVISEDSNIFERTEAFLLGRFKALPVIDKNQKPLGIITRVEVLKELLALDIVPDINVKNLMSSPVYTIDENSTIGEAKRKMKEYDAKKLVVTKKGKPVGVFSSLDLAGLAIKPKETTHMMRGVVAKKSIDDQPLAFFYRPTTITMSERSTVKEAARLMIQKEISHIIIISDKDAKPIGVLSALDIFKWVKQKLEEKVEVTVSGLDAETKMLHDEIKGTIEKIAEKFRESYGIERVKVHVKSTKSFYSVKLHVEGKEKFVVSAEGPSLEDAINIAASELKKVLGRKKTIEKSRKVRTRSKVME
ncbi:MAG: CBS domain-containing protein [Candidatus Bilamarchaeaceae archaeon]